MYHYNDYLQTTAIRGTETQHVILWNPTETVATRPLAQIRNGNFYYAVHEFVKNITEWVTTSGSIEVSYDYTPYGAIMNETGDLALGCIGFSSEVADHELGLVYYNYRHQNPLDGRWLSRDIEFTEKSDWNRYSFVVNSPSNIIDYLGRCGVTVGGVAVFVAGSVLSEYMHDDCPFAGAQYVYHNMDVNCRYKCRPKNVFDLFSCIETTGKRKASIKFNCQSNALFRGNTLVFESFVVPPFGCNADPCNEKCCDGAGEVVYQYE